MPPAASGSAGFGSAGSGSAGSGFAGTGGAWRAGGPGAAGNRLSRRPPPCAGAADVTLRYAATDRTRAWWCGSCAAGARSPGPVDAPGAPPTASGSAPRGGRSLPAATRGQHGGRPRRQRPRGAYRPPVALRTSRRPAQPTRAASHCRPTAPTSNWPPVGDQAKLDASLAGASPKRAIHAARRQVAARGAHSSLRESMCQIAWVSRRATFQRRLCDRNRGVESQRVLIA